MIKKILLQCVLIIATVSSLHAQVEKAEADIKDIMKKLDVVGLSVAVVKKGKIFYSQSFGLKNIATHTALSETDLFRIASISKSFSATSIMQMVDAGKVSLDADVSDLIGFRVRNPKFPETVITLKMLMSHTSSLNDSQSYITLDVINPAKAQNAAKCYNDYEPGKGYMYCNLNYNMVGTIIERLSGERFDNYVKRHILDPLGLYGGYNVDSLDTSRFATLYEYNSAAKTFTPAVAYVSRSQELKTYTMGYSTPLFSPTGGMKISAVDLAKYMTMHMNRGKYKGVRIISKKSSKLMQTKVQEEEGYGLAIMNVDYLIPGKHMIGHSGVAYGLFSAMFFDAKRKFGIVVITNGCNPAYDGKFNGTIVATVNSLYNNLIR